MKKFFLAFWMILTGVVAYPQISVSITTDRDTIDIGSSVTLDIQINQAQSITKLDFSPLFKIDNLAFKVDSTLADRYLDVSILDGGVFGISDENPIVEKSTTGSIPGKGKVKIGIYSVGAGHIPAPEVNGGQSAMPLESPLIIVLPPSSLSQRDTTQALKPIKDIITEEPNMEDYMWIFYLLGGILLMGLLYNLLKDKFDSKEEIVIEETPEIKEPAHVIALRALDRLKSTKAYLDEDDKSYHTELTRIIRQFLEDRYGVKALEMTTGEIEVALKSHLDKDVTSKIIEILRIADIVKFAKGESGPEINERFLYNAYDIINELKEELKHTSE